MKRSMPTARFAATASGHCPQTSFGNEGWPLSKMTPLAVVSCTAPERAGVVSTYSSTRPGLPSFAAVTATLYELENVSPVSVA